MPPSTCFDSSTSTRPAPGTKEATSSSFCSLPLSGGNSYTASFSNLAPSSSDAPRTRFHYTQRAPILETSSITRSSSGRTSGKIRNTANVTRAVTKVWEDNGITTSTPPLLLVRNQEQPLNDWLPRTNFRVTKQEKEDGRIGSGRQDEEEASTLNSMFRTQSSGVTSSTIISTSTHNASSLCDLAILADARRIEERKAAKRIANRKAASNSRARKRMQMEQLMENNASLQRYADILNALPDWILLISMDGIICFSSKHPLQQEFCPTYGCDTPTSTNFYDLLLPSSRKTLRMLIRNLIGEDDQDQEEVDILIPVGKRRGRQDCAATSLKAQSAEESISLGHNMAENFTINSKQQHLQVLATAAVTVKSNKSTTAATTNEMTSGEDLEMRKQWLKRASVVENKSEEDSSGYRPSNDSNSSTSCSNMSALDDVPVTAAVVGVSNTFEKLTPTYNLCLISKDQRKQLYEVTGSVFNTDLFKDDNNSGTDTGSNDDDILVIDNDAVECSYVHQTSSNTPNKKKSSSLTASTSRHSTSGIENETNDSNCPVNPKSKRNILLCLRPLKCRPTNASKRRL